MSQGVPHCVSTCGLISRQEGDSLHMSNPKVSGQEGRALILALMVLAISSLLVPPFLSHITVKLRTIRSTEQAMREQYASDAGVEYAIGQLLYNPSFYSSMTTTETTTRDMTVPSPVNGIWPIDVTITRVDYGGEASCSELFYIVSVAGDSRTTSQVVFCEGEGVVSISSWRIL
jgi:hypothetical protein